MIRFIISIMLCVIGVPIGILFGRLAANGKRWALPGFLIWCAILVGWLIFNVADVVIARR